MTRFNFKRKKKYSFITAFIALAAISVVLNQRTQIANLEDELDTIKQDLKHNNNLKISQLKEELENVTAAKSQTNEASISPKQENNSKATIKTKSDEQDTQKKSYSLAKRQSFGFFDDIDDENWKRMQDIAGNLVDHKFPNEPSKGLPNVGNAQFSEAFTWYQTNYEPNFSCAHEQRVGGNGNGDGPKWVCDPHRITRVSNKRKAENPDKNSPGCVVYSIGSECDFQFELGMQKAVGVGTCEYHTFDPGDYENCIPEELQNAHYHRWGLIKQKDNGENPPKPGQQYYGLKDTMKMLGHDKLEEIDVFKIDCEGCEWVSFNDWLDPEIPRLNQILVELHAPKKDDAVKFFDTLQAEGYVRTHKEANIQFYHGGAIEYVFLKLEKDFLPAHKLKA